MGMEPLMTGSLYINPNCTDVSKTRVLTESYIETVDSMAPLLCSTIGTLLHLQNITDKSNLSQCTLLPKYDISLRWIFCII